MKIFQKVLFQVHERKKFDESNSPEKDGISAGLYDINTKAYVGKFIYKEMYKPGRIQTTKPKPGIYTTARGANYYDDKNAYYLVNNPKYHYYWVDSFEDNFIANAVSVKITDTGLMNFYIGRNQIDGQMQVAPIALSIGMMYPGYDGLEHFATSFQILACDPLPNNPCSK
mgnify:CR=1 FL=1